MVSVFFVAPLLSSNVLLMRYRLLLALMIVLCVFPWVSEFVKEVPSSFLMYVLLLVKELFVGIVIGFFISLIFAAFQLSTQFFSTQIGLGMSQVLDPMTQEEVSLFSYLYYLLAMLMFLVIGGLHMVIMAVVDSYKVLPVMEVIEHSEVLMEHAVKYFSFMFVLGLKIAFPILGASMLVTFALGLIGKAAPQANILILGLPLQYGMGLVIVFLSVPFLVHYFEGFFLGIVDDVMRLFEGMGGTQNV